MVKIKRLTSAYEYIRLKFDFGDLAELNSLASVGWRVVSVKTIPFDHFRQYALLERQIHD